MATVRTTRTHSVRQEHGPRDAYYSMLPDFKPHPVIECLCGWFPPQIHDNWEEVGESFDQHIRAALRA